MMMMMMKKKKKKKKKTNNNNYSNNSNDCMTSHHTDKEQFRDFLIWPNFNYTLLKIFEGDFKWPFGAEVYQSQ